MSQRIAQLLPCVLLLACCQLLADTHLADTQKRYIPHFGEIKDKETGAIIF